MKQVKQSIRFRTTDKKSDALHVGRVGILSSRELEAQLRTNHNVHSHHGVIVRLNQDAGFGYVKDIMSNQQYIFTLGDLIGKSGTRFARSQPLIGTNAAVEFVTDDQSRVTRVMLDE